MRMLFTLLLATLITFALHSQDGLRLGVRIDGFQQDTLYLGYYLGDKQYLRDTVTAGPDGQFVFTSAEEAPGGMYLVVLPPNNDFFQVLLNPGEQRFDLHTQVDDLVNKMQVKGSRDNELFYDYLGYLNEKRPVAEKLNQAMKDAGDDNVRKQAVQAQLDKLNDEVTAYQHKIVQDNPKTLTAAIVQANWNVDMPEFEGDDTAVQVKRWRYMQQHVFDNIDLGDPRLLRTPFFFERIDYFVHKLQVQHPDTIAQAIDVVLEKTRPAEETFRFYLVHYLNEAARSDLVGMDAVYVNLVEKYYKTGQATWTDAESMKKIIENSDALKPLLIGKIAPNIAVQRRDGSKTSLYDVDADYTILYFWRYDCGHCKESTPHMKEFYEKFKDKGVKIFAVCVKFTDEVPGCWKYVDENEIGDWLHTVDPYNLSKFTTVYDIKSTPQIYILDRKKEILSKRIGATQLEEVLTRIMEIQEKEGGDLKD